MMNVYEVRSRKDRRGVNLISDALQFGRLWCGEPNASGFVIKNYRPPHPIGVKGGCSPPEQLWKFSTIVNQRLLWVGLPSLF